MNVIYERILELCKERSTTYNSVCKELGIFPSVVGNLKSNENKVLKTDTAIKLADYFGVSVEYLVGHEKKPTTEGDGLTKEQVEFLKLIPEMEESEYSALLSYAKFLVDQRKSQDVGQ